MDASDVAIRQVAAANLTEGETAVIRDLLRVAFADDVEGFTDADWKHAAGGTHFLLENAGAVLAYASVVLRELEVDGRTLRVGYVEAVATRRDVQGRRARLGRCAGGQRAHPKHIRAGRAEHRAPRLLPATRLGTVARIHGRADGAWTAADS